MDIEIMIDDFVLFFFAGQESTADALASCFLELMLNSECFKKYF
jgi:cytochrome P450